MTELPESLYRPEDVRELDRCAMEEHDLGDGRLMERAGRVAYRILRRRWPDARRVLVLCGGGNNGGDGYVVARLAVRDGLEVTLAPLSDPERLRGDAARAARRCLAERAASAFDPGQAGNADVIVDALLGTGLDRPVAGRYAEAIGAVNDSAAGVLAVDIPSGINGATGQRLGHAVRADVTPTFIGLKQGMFTGDAPDHVGEVVFDDLGVPAAVYDAARPSARLVGAAHIRNWLPPRPRSAHKGRYGHVLVVGGDHGMGGAARMAAEAAARAGAGLVSVATRREHVPAILAARPELMVRGADSPGDIDALLERASVVAVGPGLGRDAWGREMLARVERFSGPVLMDADALNLLAEGTAEARAKRVLTPHPGEAARLLGTTVPEIMADRFQSASRLQQRYGGCVVLKGAGTVVATGEEGIWVCDRGNPGMATGGMGDVLSGVVAGLLAQALSPSQAAVAGVWLHGRAADLAAEDGERGMLATDLLPHLRRLANP